MAIIDTKSKFHVALDGQGLILQGAPDRPSYQSGQAPLYGQRFASGDRSYNDLSSWWYFVQTSWAAGIKDTVSWADDAKFYYSSNIDTWSDNGAIKLLRLPALVKTFTENIVCGVEAEVNSNTQKYVGTEDAASGKPIIYRDDGGGTWTDISSSTMSTNNNIISQLSGRLNILWASVVGSGTTNVVLTWNGTSFTDQSANIYNAGSTISFQPTASRCHTSYQTTQYVFVDDPLNFRYALVKTTQANPSSTAHWSKVFERTSDSSVPVSCCIFNGKLYYLLSRAYIMELRCYDIANDVDTQVTIFRNASPINGGVGDKCLVVNGGKLVITVPNKEIWLLDSSDNLTRIHILDEYKYNVLGTESRGYLVYGAVVADNKVFWGNLMFDGTYFHNGWKDLADSTGLVYQHFVDNQGVIYHSESSNPKKLYSYTVTGSTYKGTAGKNWVVFSNFDNISGIDKLAYSATIIFKPLASGQKIIVEYTTGELTASTSWTQLGEISAVNDGVLVTDKTIFFPAATTFKKIWIRIKLEASSGTDTPTVTDFVMEYLPAPSYKKNWAINVNVGDDVKRLDGRLVETVARELKGKLERSWWTKSVLDFQDLDYAGTTLSGLHSSSATTLQVVSTRDFPEQGRIRIDDEEITYTGKTPTTFTGCTRGARSTRAASHNDASVINNAYKVIITDMSTRVPVALEGKELEYVMGISIREV